MATNARDVEEHLRAASDAILLLVDEVDQLERHKRGVIPGEPRFAELATAVRQAADKLSEFTREEETWAKAADMVAGDQLTSIAETTNARPLSEILSRWREVERQLHEAAPGSEEAENLFDEFSKIRDEYMAAFRARHRTR